MSPLFDKKVEGDNPTQLTQALYQAQEQLESGKAADTTVLLSDLSHQLEEARKTNEHLENKNRDISTRLMRAEAARDAMKDLLQELWKSR